MVIYENPKTKEIYDINDVLFNAPYVDEKLKLYPLMVRDYKRFQKYLGYFIMSKKHYGLTFKQNLFEYVIQISVARLKKEIKEELNIVELINIVVKDLIDAFTIICKEQIKIDLEKFNNGEIVLINENRDICIDKSNFDKARRIILKQNIIQEPKIFEDDFEKELAEKWIKAQHNKNTNIINGLGEMANLISCETGKSYIDIYNQNILQLYCDYYRCINNKEFQTTILFKTVSNETNIIPYQKEVISQIFADPYSDMWKDANSFLGGLGYNG